jgi:RNA polymerase sigma-70 factor (ECF subfamily)
MTEESAIAQLRKGNIAGLETLVALYGEKALKASFLVCRDYALAEDVVQSSFIQAYERIHQLDSNRPFRPWFMRSVVNATLMAVTRNREVSMQNAEGVAYEQEDGSPTPEELVQRVETREELRAAMDALSPKQRSAIILRYYLQLSDDEIAETVSAPAGTVRRRLHDARQRLRQLLSN